MKLLTVEILKKLPFLGSQENRAAKDVRIYVKFFNPIGPGTWYASEYDPEQRLFFGYAKITDGELGYFSLDELQSLKLPLCMKIERDLHWNDRTTLQDVMDGRVS